MFRMLASTSSVAVITVVVALYCYLVTRVCVNLPSWLFWEIHSQEKSKFSLH